jgi:hypothetical protein
MHRWQGPGPITLREIEEYHWHGDPEMMVITGVPQVPVVTIAGPIMVEDSVVSVSCNIDGALVAMTDQGTLLGRAYVSGGRAMVPLSPPPQSPTTLDIVVTGHNLVPWQGAWEVVEPASPWLRHRAHTIDDSAGGNGDGLLNPGESVVMAVTVENIGDEDGTGISSTLGTASPSCTVTDGAADFPDIAAGAMATTLPDHFAFTLDSEASHGELVLALKWTADGGLSGGFDLSTMVCEPLLITNLAVTEITESSARITWTTNVPASTRLSYGIMAPLPQVVESSILTTSHSVLLSDLDSCTRYLFVVTSESPGCYQVTEDNGGTSYSFTTSARMVIFFDDVESGDAGWTAEPPWAISDEASFSATHSWTDSPGGSYDNSVDIRLTSPVIEVTGLTGLELSFFHTPYLDWWNEDTGTVEVTSDGGTTWTPVAFYTGQLDTWTEEIIDLSAFSGSDTLQIGFRLTADSSSVSDGWHIDDIEVSATKSCSVGMVRLGETVYPCDSTISVIVTDLDLNTDDTVQETASALIASNTEPSPELVLLTETGLSSTTFVGTIDTSPGAPIPDGMLSLSDGDLITATYEDADDGCGTPATAATTAQADCSPPVISDVQVPLRDLTSGSALVVWHTDEEATAVVTIEGTSIPVAVAATGLATEHVVTVTGLSGCTTYDLSVTSCDRWGHCTTDDNGGNCVQLVAGTQCRLCGVEA